jgi:adenylate kinase
MRVIILFGAPGVGKGTQAELLAKKLNFEHLSTGNLLRKEIASGSTFGKEIAEIMKSGKLISDETVNKLAKNFLEKNISAEGVILDGYPRTVFQARELDKILEELDISNIKIVNLIADEEELTKRLLLRSQKEGRADDNEETIKKRFEVYNGETFPILDYYENTAADVSDIDGIGEIGEIHQRIVSEV